MCSEIKLGVPMQTAISVCSLCPPEVPMKENLSFNSCLTPCFLEMHPCRVWGGRNQGLLVKKWFAPGPSPIYFISTKEPHFCYYRTTFPLEDSEGWSYLKEKGCSDPMSLHLTQSSPNLLPEERRRGWKWRDISFHLEYFIFCPHSTLGGLARTGEGNRMPLRF